MKIYDVVIREAGGCVGVLICMLVKCFAAFFPKMVKQLLPKNITVTPIVVITIPEMA